MNEPVIIITVIMYIKQTNKQPNKQIKTPYAKENWLAVLFPLKLHLDKNKMTVK